MKSLGSQLDPRLVARSRKYEQLSLLLHQHLPAECDGHYAVANILNQQLVIVADSPVWANRLRQLAPRILALVQKTASRIQHIQIKTRMTSAGKPGPGPAIAPVVKRRISQHASEQIVSAASCISDESLKRALLKLSRHTGKKNS